MSNTSPFDPGPNMIVPKDKKSQTLATTIVATSILFVVVYLQAGSGITGRTGEPKVQIEKVGERELIECVDLSGWTDSYGNGCNYYIENEDDCENYANSVGSDGQGPTDACCACQNVSNCSDVPGWIDFYEDSCHWYEENEPLGCPNEGHVNGTNNVNASEACCHCRATSTDENGDIHGRWSGGAFDSTPTTVWLIMVGIVILLLIVVLRQEKQYYRVFDD